MIKKIAILIMALVVFSCDGKGKKSLELAPKNSVKKDGKKYSVTLVELGSVRCVPCQMMSKVLDQVKKKYGDKVKIVFHDVWTEEGRPFARQYGIRAIPTQVFLDKNGNEYFRHMGYFRFDEVVKVIEQKL